MPKRTITHDEVTDYLSKLSYPEFRDVVYNYSTTAKVDFEKELDAMITLNFQNRLEKLGINKVCPKCDSPAVTKYGLRNRIQVYKCKSCNSKFTLFTDTILEKTNWHWDFWIVALGMLISNYSLESMAYVLETDFGCYGINHKTVWLWRMKLIHAIAALPMPVLSGVVQIDETFIRESQKGSRKLVSYIGKQDVRKPRYGRRPSKFGVMGPEFATVTTAISSTGHCVCKVTGLGKLTKEVLVDLFEKNLENPSYICSDANSVYEDYCNLFNITHYEKPSSYMSLIYKSGFERPDYDNPAQAEITAKQNEKILEKLYYENFIDRISNRGYMPYEEFKELKKQNGLNLGRVNSLHADIKAFLYIKMRNVSTKYLQDYVGYFTYIRNWKVQNGNYPQSRKDAEKIFIEILKSKVSYTIKDINEKKLDLPKPSARYVSILKQKTEKVRRLTSNKYFKFDEEDGVKTFNKREYLLDQKKSKLHAICKECKLTKYKKFAQWSLVSLILKQPNIDDIIYKLLSEDRRYQISDEDHDAIADQCWVGKGGWGIYRN